VKSGRAELFLVAVEDGRPVSRRQFLFEVKAGGNIMPLLESFETLQVVLIATEACTLEPLSFEVLKAEGQHGGDISKIPEQIDRWITGLSSAAVAAVGVPPNGTQALMPGDKLDSGAVAAITVRSGARWCESADDALSY